MSHNRRALIEITCWLLVIVFGASWIQSCTAREEARRQRWQQLRRHQMVMYVKVAEDVLSRLEKIGREFDLKNWNTRVDWREEVRYIKANLDQVYEGKLDKYNHPKTLTRIAIHDLERMACKYSFICKGEEYEKAKWEMVGDLRVRLDRAERFVLPVYGFWNEGVN